MTKHTLGESHFVTLLDGRKLHYREQGPGGPTVIFESGLSFSSATWGLVQPDVSKKVRAVVYDRAGVGRSDWDDADRTIDRLADDLEQLLQKSTGPFILVGYSWGGPIVRRLAARRTVDIRGLVLLDQVDERNPEYFTEAKAKRFGLITFIVLWFMHTVGLLFAAKQLLRNMPADCRNEILLRDILWRGARVAHAELSQFLDGITTLRSEPDVLAGIDVSVITGTNPDSMEARFRPAFVRAHRRTAKALAKGRLVRAPQSAHFTPITEPELVVREILALVDRVGETNVQED